MIARVAVFRRRCLVLIGAAMLAGIGATFAATNSNHWAFQPLRRPAVPGRSHSTQGAIDAFVASAVAKEGSSLPAQASRGTLIRRLSFDLRGLPPSPEEVSVFLEDKRSDAYERLVERFLGSARYGERWGRHWLDIAGYADSNGYFSADSDRPFAWKFRDYVVRSISSDKPLDQFIREQVAGDELAGYVAGGDITPEMIDPLIATHFWRDAPDGTMESDGNPLEVKVDKYAVIEGSVQIFGSAFLGLTLQCARCHDHKFEPVTQEEYYALQAILRPAFDPNHWLKPSERAIEIGTRAEREAHQRQTAQIERDLKTLQESLEGLTAPFRKQALEENLRPIPASLREAIHKALDTKEKERTDAMKSLLKTNAALVDLNGEILQKKFAAFGAAADPLRQAIKAAERDKPIPLERIAALFEPTNAPPPHHLFLRGNHANEGKEIAPGIPSIFRLAFQTTAGLPGKGGESARFSEEDAQSGLSGVSAGQDFKPVSSGRRLALANWLTSPQNPIVARVLVNRLWHYHFGEGLASTVDNLGQSGKPPVAPELLDWLASELVESGWSLKHLHRLILNSATWKHGPNFPGTGESGSRGVTGQGKGRREESAGGARPVEAKYWALIAEPRRLDAESLRDSMLAVSGELDLTSGGPYVPTTTDQQGQVIIDEKQPGGRRRSIYLQQRRTFPVNFLATFDGPAHNPVCVQRVSSTVALQSLSMLNSEFARARARAFALRVLGREGLPDKPLGNQSRPLDDSSSKQRSGLTPAVDLEGRSRALRFAFDLAYTRPPTADELSAAEAFLRKQEGAYSGKTDARERSWVDLCQMLLASNAFLYVD